MHNDHDAKYICAGQTPLKTAGPVAVSIRWTAVALMRRRSDRLPRVIMPRRVVLSRTTDELPVLPRHRGSDSRRCRTPGEWKVGRSGRSGREPRRGARRPASGARLKPSSHGDHPQRPRPLTVAGRLGMIRQIADDCPRAAAQNRDVDPPPDIAESHRRRAVRSAGSISCLLPRIRPAQGRGATRMFGYGAASRCRSLSSPVRISPPPVSTATATTCASAR